MKRCIVMLVVVVAALSGNGSPGWAQGDSLSHGNDQMAGGGSIALGFHDTTTPLGGRYWFSNGSVGVDFGFGVTAERAVLTQGGTQTLLGYTLGLGVPLPFRKWSKLQLMFRPGGSFGQQDETLEFENLVTGAAFSVVAKRTTFVARFEVEAEYFLTQRFSISASHGAQLTTSKINRTDDIRDFNASTTANELTNLGFHYYLWGVK